MTLLTNIKRFSIWVYDIVRIHCSFALKNPSVWCEILYFPSLREKCPYSEFLWSAFSRIRTEYGGMWSISSYSVRMRENTNQKNSEYGHFSRSASFMNLFEYVWIIYLIHFLPLVSPNTPYKHLKTSGFLIFSWGIDRELWHEMS